ncbi:MAG: beta-propeller fold lactonase family protein [Enterocloster bolteae]
MRAAADMRNVSAGPHAHSMILFGHDAYGLVCDLGRDRIEAYGLDRNGHMNYVKSFVHRMP